MYKRNGFVKEYSSTREIWAEYWKKQNKRKNKKTIDK